jgi:spore germination cell wall hydrolase CwlJ-like protein
MTDLDWITLAERPPKTAEPSAHGTAPSDAFFGIPDQPADVMTAISSEPPLATRRPAKQWLPVRRAGYIVSAAAIAVLLRSSVPSFSDETTVRLPPASDSTKVAATEAVINLPPPDLVKPLSPEEAAKENAERPFVSRPDTPAARFLLPGDAANRERAVTCLTQAVYYEAAGEGPDGGRAVAQVVLNRMRHPGYPASVCGVIYQGADRSTGCQFTFTCDGSLLREPVASLWARSRKIAEKALAGGVFAPIGHATHYHADYVLPYWADSLDKTVQIGHHIFYRLRSLPGDSRSFSQHYGGSEPLPPSPDPAVVIAPGAVTDQLATALINDGVAGAGPTVEKAAPPASPAPLIDSLHGTLAADDPGVTVQVKQPKQPVDCPASGDPRQLRPLGANDVRAGDTHTSC